MAFLPRTNLFGRWIGLTRETTNATGNVFFSARGIAAPYLYLHATEPTANSTSSIVDIEGLTTITTLSTGTAAVATRGIALVSSAASTAYTLAAPPAAGVRKTLFTTSSSTLVRQVKVAVDVVGGMSAHSDSGTLTASTSFTVLTFNALGQCIELIGLSTAAWLNTSLRGFSTAATPLSS